MGVNYPWIASTWDFGHPPVRPDARGQANAWSTANRGNWAALTRALVYMREQMGITVVRWWVIAGGLNYPESQTLTDAGFQISTGENNADIQFRFPGGQYNILPQLSTRYLDDFQAFTSACHTAGVQVVPVVPSFMSFEWFQPYSFSRTSRGRTRLALGEERDGALIDAFLYTTLAPLVRSCAPGSIFAWEVINEPDWVTAGGPWHPVTEARVPEPLMRKLIASAARIITSASMDVTVGFARNPDGSPGTAWANNIVSDLKGYGSRYVHQVHHYPSPIVYSGPLPTRDRSFPRAVIGEFASSNSTEGIENTSWSDDGLAEDDVHLYLERRLERIKLAGWDGAWTWSARSADTRSAWRTLQHEQIARFMFR